MTIPFLDHVWPGTIVEIARNEYNVFMVLSITPRAANTSDVVVLHERGIWTIKRSALFEEHRPVLGGRRVWTCYAGEK